MTLSPGQKVQPNRSMRISPGGFERVLQLHIERAGAEAATVHRAEHLDVAYRVEPEALRDPLLHDRHELAHPLLGVDRIDEVEVASLDRGEIGHQALVDAVRVGDDAALGSLAEDLSQAHDRHGTGSDDVGKNLPRPD